MDYITDFTIGSDKIVLNKTTFGNISSDDIAIVASDVLVTGSEKSIVYSKATGNLFFNANEEGYGYGVGGKFAKVDSDNNPWSAPPVLGIGDFVIVV